MEFPGLGEHCSERTCKQLGKERPRGAVKGSLRGLKGAVSGDPLDSARRMVLKGWVACVLGGGVSRFCTLSL